MFFGYPRSFPAALSLQQYWKQVVLQAFRRDGHGGLAVRKRRIAGVSFGRNTLAIACGQNARGHGIVCIPDVSPLPPAFGQTKAKNASCLSPYVCLCAIAPERGRHSCCSLFGWLSSMGSACVFPAAFVSLPYAVYRHSALQRRKHYGDHLWLHTCFQSGSK